MGSSYSMEPRRPSEGVRQQLREMGFYLAVVGFGLIAWGGWNVVDNLAFARGAHREVVRGHDGSRTPIMLDRTTGERRDGLTAHLVLPHGLVVALGGILVWAGSEIIARNRVPRSLPPRR